MIGINNKTFILRSNTKGSALLAALIILLLLTMIGFAAVTTSNVEIQISGNQRLTNTALYAAEAGVERIRSELSNSTPPYDDSFNLTYVFSSSANPSYRIYAGIENWPKRGTENRGDLWSAFNSTKVIIANRSPDGSPMYVFLAEGYSGLATKRMEVGIVPPDGGSGGAPDPSGTTYAGGAY